MSTEMSYMKEMVAMLSVVKILHSTAEADKECRKTTLCAQIDEEGGASVRFGGQGDFLILALSIMFHDLARKTNNDPEELYYILVGLNEVIKAGGKMLREEPELKIKFEGERDRG